MRGLNVLELVHECVVLGVCDSGGVEKVVEVLVMAKFGAKFFRAFGGIRVGVFGVAHGVNYRGLQPRGSSVTA
jgi:hypothetical protein